MQVPANESGDKLIMDYLARVTEAGLRLLPKGARIAFVGQTRVLLERECGPSGQADPARVMEVLIGLGEPEDLVRQERARIDDAWLKRRNGNGGANDAPPVITAPRQARPLTSRWKPATDTQPMTRAPGPWPPAPPGPPAGAGHGSTAGSGPGPGWPGQDPARGSGPQPGGVDAPGPLPPAPGRPGARTGARTRAVTRAGTRARAVARLARRHPLESAAVVLLGIGGAILPFPCWLLGGAAAALSRIFDRKDTLAALAGPFLIALAGTLVTAVLDGGPGNPVVVYVRALGADTGYLLRAGCLVCAGYLAWRMHRGRRVRVPPWRR